MTLPAYPAWTEDSIPEWFTRCDKCNHWYLYARFHEFYGEEGWWRECMDCSFESVTDLVTDGKVWRK